MHPDKTALLDVVVQVDIKFIMKDAILQLDLLQDCGPRGREVKSAVS